MSWHSGNLPDTPWGDAYSNKRQLFWACRGGDCRPAVLLRARWIWSQDENRRGNKGLPFVEFNEWLQAKLQKLERYSDEAGEIRTLLHSRGVV